MPSPALRRRVRRTRFGHAALLAFALAAAGCGTGGLPSSTSTGNGQQLFVKGEGGKPSCGSCHTLADAGTQGTIGPNLDDAFRAARQEKFEDADSTISAIVADQIRYPGREKLTFAGARMPADLVTGDNVAAVADYVASVAGLPPKGGGGGGGGKITATGGREIFETAGCASCHTLADAGSTGTIGPNLDQAKPSKALAVQRVTNGMGAMPSFRDRLSKQQIDAVAAYVSTAARG